MSQNTTTDDEEQTENQLRFDIEADWFREFMAPIQALADEVKLRFDHDGLHVTAVDPANVAMIDAELYNTAFSTWEATEGVIGLYTRDIVDLLEEVPDGATVRFETVPEFRKFTIDVDRFTWKEAWIQPDSIRREPELPDLDLPARITLSSTHFKQIVHYAQFVDRGGKTVFKVDPDRREFTAESMGDTDDGVYTLSEGDGLIIHELGSANSQYSNDYLKDLARGVPEGVDVTLELGEEFPLRMRYGITEGQFVAMQAPRIQSD